MNEKLILNDEQSDTSSHNFYIQLKEKLMSEINKNELMINSIKNWVGRANKEMKSSTKERGIDARFENMCSTLKGELKKYVLFVINIGKLQLGWTEDSDNGRMHEENDQVDIGWGTFY